MAISKGLIHIYCGDGKGKTTAALGLAIRACGDENKVLVVQFLKTAKSGELSILNGIENIQILRYDKPLKFTFNMNKEELRECKKIQQNLFDTAIEICKKDNINMVVFDEIIGAYNKNFLDKIKVKDFLDNKLENLEVVLTGRNPRDELLEKADYISEIVKVKHPFDIGINARKGVEM